MKRKFLGTFPVDIGTTEFKDYTDRLVFILS